MLATIDSATLFGVDGSPVRVEVHISDGLPAFAVVGLPDATCREARDRVRSALLSVDQEWPNKRVTVNLAPSTVRKAGSGLDLAIAVGVLVANGVIKPEAVAGVGFVGELGLDGSIRPVSGALPLIDAMVSDTVVVPVSSVVEARLVRRHRVLPVRNLREVVEACRDEAPWPEPPSVPEPPADSPLPDLADVRGQPMARLALEVAAAGGHHLLMVGPPGAGKTMLASRLPSLLPELDHDQAMEVTRIHSAAGQYLPPRGLIERPPFRAPHHGASPVALVGGGTSWMRPGEISLAAHGVLFLDELGEFAPVALDSLRQPLEDGVIRLSRAHAAVTFPARFLLVAAMNPCPCGEAGRPGGCGCSDAARFRYRRRLSGPLLDRFDLRIEVSSPAVDQLMGVEPGEGSAAVFERVRRVRELAADRGVRVNGQIPSDRLDELAPLDHDARRLLIDVLDDGRLSGRGLQRVRCVARTLADLDGHEEGAILEQHISLALALRVQPAAFQRATVR